MFTDMKEALEAEALHLTPPSSDQSTAASVVVARHARDKDDLAGLLSALALPCAEDDLVRLLPHLTAHAVHDDAPTGDPMTVNAYTATAASDTLGLSQSELAEAVQHAENPAPDSGAVSMPGPDGSINTPEAPAPVTAADSTADPADTGGIETLLAWAESHPAAGIRNRAARVRSDLTELTDRRCADAAQRRAAERVAKAKAELEAAQKQLRAVKSGGRAATTAQGAALPVPAATPAARTGKARRGKNELAAIRAWAHAHGHRVADRGNPPKAVMDAYDAAHRTTGETETS